MSMLVSNNIPNSIVDVATAGKDGVYGVVKIPDDGSLSITEDGVLSQTAEFVMADPSTTPPTPGLVKVDGVTIKIGSNGIISGASAMNIATPNTAGTVMPDGKSIKILPDGTIYTDGKPPVATASRLGTVKLDGSSIKADNDGTLHAEVDTSNLPVFKAETITDKGVNGVAPKPTTKDVGGYLCADGTWGKIEVDPPQTIKDEIEQLITDEKTATLSKDVELNKAVDDIPAGHKTTIAVGDMTSFTANTGGILKIKLNFVAPNVMSVTTTLNKEAVIMRAGGVMIRRSTTEYPKTIKDGDLVIDVKAADLSKYEATGYVDENNIVDGTVYYYTAFPYTSDGVYNESGNDANHAVVKGIKGEIYGYDIHQPDDNPDHRVSYPSDVMNATWDPISITLDSDNYDLGKWANTFFMKGIRPVMLKYDGTVDYELDHNDQTKKLDGTASDVSNENYQGNAMVEFPKMYFARWTDSNGEWSHVRVSNVDLGDIKDDNGNVVATCKCYAHMTEVGGVIKELPYVYIYMFEGYVDSNGKMRSLADKAPTNYTSGTQEIDYCKANGEGWQLDDWSNTAMVEDLLMLLGKTTDVQKKYGRGNDSGGSLLTTGTLKGKGEFWGANSSDGTKAVKFFWLENYYADRWNRKQGMVTNGSSHICVKMYPPYDVNGAGYIDTGIVPSGSSGSYIKTTDVSEYGNLPKTLDGSSDKYQPDGYWYSSGCFLFFGGTCTAGLGCGCAFFLGVGVGNAYWDVGGSPSFKKTS